MGMQALAAGETVRPASAAPAARRPARPRAGHAPPSRCSTPGIDLANAELDAATGVNCVKPGTPAQDDNGHGTNVAGIIAARNTGKGVVGVAPGTRVYAVKVLNNRAVGTLSQFLCGINWVAANAAALNIRVANMSIGGVGQRRRLRHAQRRLRAQGDLRRRRRRRDLRRLRRQRRHGLRAHRPRRLPRGAHRDGDHRHRRAARRARPGLVREEGARRPHRHLLELRGRAAEAAHAVAAPGPCVTSAGLGGKTSTYTGTSQAAPHVAGAVALCHGSGGLPGPCAGLAPAAVIARAARGRRRGATLATGFLGDPLRPLSGKVFGPLVTAASY